jgi:hypothetical protein
MPGFEKDQRKIASIVEYPYLYRLETVKSKGKVGLMAGSHDAESEANNANSKLNRATFSQIEHKDIFGFFNSSVRFYCNYFDYIILDTAPSLEGNILNKLAVRAADEIITPVDGIEAALGMRTLLSWVLGENRSGGYKPPNMTFAMVKYHTDLNKLVPDPGLRMRNSVFRAMKGAFGDYVCDNGVKESPTFRKIVSGFRGSKTDYYALSEEIIDKLGKTRNNIFDQINIDTFKKLESELLELHAKAQKEKTPTFKNPYFQNGDMIDKGATTTTKKAKAKGKQRGLDDAE